MAEKESHGLKIDSEEKAEETWPSWEAGCVFCQALLFSRLPAPAGSRIHSIKKSSRAQREP